MNKLLFKIVIISIKISFISSVSGNYVNCGTPSTGNSRDCYGCGVNSDFYNLFVTSSSPSCQVLDCLVYPGFNPNGWMCKSCYGITGSHPIYSGPLLQGDSCITACRIGYIADSNQICQPIITGTDVACGTSSPSTGLSSDCKGCAINSAASILFQPSTSPYCKVVDCFQNPGTLLNGWMCKSCYGISGTYPIYSGPFLQGNACAVVCSTNFAADSNYICQPINLGTEIACGTSSSPTGLSSDCIRCAINSTAWFLFQPSTSPYCKVVDCFQNPGAHLNGWMCKSCYGISGAYPIYSGPFLQGNVCVVVCSTNFAADSNYICQPINLLGTEIACGTSSSPTGLSSDCNRCAINSAASFLFQPSTSPYCKVVNCFQNPGTLLNGWMCKSCYGISGAYPIYSGPFLQGNACAVVCSTNFAADSNYICQPINLLGTEIACGTSSSPTGLSSDCNRCAINSAASFLFQPSTSPYCKVVNCFQNPGTLLNGWMCKSCYGISGAYPIYSGPFLQGNACVVVCSTNFAADSNYICQPINLGTEVACGTSSSPTGLSSDCNRCVINSAASFLFQPSTSPYCKVVNCFQNPGTFLNGWMCKSCYGISGAYPIYSGPILQGNACAVFCSTFFAADSNYICQPINLLGTEIACGTSSSPTGLSSDCNRCAINSAASFLFQPSTSPYCKVVNCFQNPGTLLNGWMCKSCYGISGAYPIYSGPFLQGNACVVVCSKSFTADSNQICQPINLGTDVNCGTASTGNYCYGCGDNIAVQNLFMYSSATSTCKVINCSADPLNNLNGWMCKSCHSVINAHPAYFAGRFLQGTSCAFSCQQGYISDANQICQRTAVAGSDVACGNISKTSVYTTNCQGCGVSQNIQNLFTISINPNCKVIDCSQNPGSNLNGWMCKSCKGITGAHSAYSAGKLLSGNACVAYCPSGQTADPNNICIPGFNSGSIELTQIFTMLLICLLS